VNNMISSGYAFKYVQEVIDDFEEKHYPDLSEAVILFSKINHTKVEPQYIYMGHEKLTFNERHPLYQKIFREEFSTCLKSMR